MPHKVEGGAKNGVKNVNKSSHPCFECGLMFARRADFEQHQAAVHGNGQNSGQAGIEPATNGTTAALEMVEDAKPTFRLCEQCGMAFDMTRVDATIFERHRIEHDLVKLLKALYDYEMDAKKVSQELRSISPPTNFPQMIEYEKLVQPCFAKFQANSKTVAKGVAPKSAASSLAFVKKSPNEILTKMPISLNRGGIKKRGRPCKSKFIANFAHQSANTSENGTSKCYDSGKGKRSSQFDLTSPKRMVLSGDSGDGVQKESFSGNSVNDTDQCGKIAETGFEIKCPSAVENQSMMKIKLDKNSNNVVPVPDQSEALQPEVVDCQVAKSDSGNIANIFPAAGIKEEPETTPTNVMAVRRSARKSVEAVQNEPVARSTSRRRASLKIVEESKSETSQGQVMAIDTLMNKSEDQTGETSVVAPTPSKLLSSVCPYCTQQCKRPWLLIEHMVDQHDYLLSQLSFVSSAGDCETFDEMKQTNKCYYCEESIAVDGLMPKMKQSSTLLMHLLKHHKDKLFVCPPSTSSRAITFEVSSASLIGCESKKFYFNMTVRPKAAPAN